MTQRQHKGALWGEFGSRIPAKTKIPTRTRASRLRSGQAKAAPHLGGGAVALFVFLAGAAWAGVVAADFFRRAADSLHRGGVTGAGQRRLLQFAALSALKGLFDLIERGGSAAARAAIATIDADLRRRWSRRHGARRRFALHHLHEVEIANGIFLEALHHGFEHVEGFALVLHQRIVLGIAAQADAFLEVVHVQQVIFPLLVDNSEHDHALVVAHGIGAEALFFGVVALAQLLKDGIAQLGAVEFFQRHAFGSQIHAEASEELVLERGEIPLIGMLGSRRVLIEQVAEDSFNVILNDEL